MFFGPAMILAITLAALGRNKPLPVLDRLLAGGQPVPPPLPGGNGIGVRDVTNRATANRQPAVPAERMHVVTYLMDGARYFHEKVCADLFEVLRSCALEPVTLAGGNSRPGVFRLIPLTDKREASAADAVMEAATHGILTFLTVATVLPEFAGADRIVVFDFDPGIANPAGQLACLGPIRAPKRAMAAAPSSTSSSSSSSATPAPTLLQTLELELAQLEASGLPQSLVRDALTRPEMKPGDLDEIAATLPAFPSLVAALRGRAAILRAKERIEEALTAPVATSSSSSPHVNGAASSTPNEPIETEGRTVL